LPFLYDIERVIREEFMSEEYIVLWVSGVLIILLMALYVWFEKGKKPEIEGELFPNCPKIEEPEAVRVCAICGKKKGGKDHRKLVEIKITKKGPYYGKTGLICTCYGFMEDCLFNVYNDNKNDIEIIKNEPKWLKLRKIKDASSMTT
jgi:hypothetical protein